MKPQFVLACILAIACLISQKALALLPDLTTSWEAREYVRAIAENVHETVVAILSVPPEQQTFENTLQPWDRLSEQLFQDYDTLHELVEARISSSTAAAEAFEDLHTFLIEITQNPQLCQKLVQCAQRVSKDSALNPLQRSIAKRLLTHYYIDGLLIATNYDIILCGGKAEVSVSHDNEGNSSVEGSVSFSGKSDSGVEYSGGVGAEVNHDSDGHVSSEVTVRGNWSW